MWRSITVFALTVLAPSQNGVGAQAARVGRLPVLELPPAGVGTCKTDPLTAELRRGRIARMISFTSSDSAGERLVSLGLDAKGAPVMLMAMMGTEAGRRGEAETVHVSYGPSGSIEYGRRSAFTTGTPSRLSDDRQLALLPTDTLMARRLADAVRRRCRA